MNNSFYKQLEVKLPKDIYNNKISKKTKESSNASRNNFKNTSQSFQNLTLKDKSFKYIGNKKKKINQNNSIKIEENKQFNYLSNFNINNKTFINSFGNVWPSKTKALISTINEFIKVNVNNDSIPK